MCYFFNVMKRIEDLRMFQMKWKYHIESICRTEWSFKKHHSVVLKILKLWNTFHLMYCTLKILVMISSLKFCYQVYAYIYLEYIESHLKKIYLLRSYFKKLYIILIFEGGGIRTSSGEDWPCPWNKGRWPYHCSHRSRS